MKDHATAIRALEQVMRRRAEARLVLVGEGPERVTIQDEIQRRGLEDYVRLLGLRTDVPRLLAAADVALLTSVSEGIPLALIEAMVARLPVVATQVGGVGEVVAEGRTGLLAPPGDDAALAEAILRLAGAPDMRQAMGGLGRERAFARFSDDQMLVAYERLYSEMIARRVHSTGSTQ